MVSAETLAAWSSISDLITSFRGPQIDIEQDRVLLRGRLLRLEDWEALTRLRVPFQMQLSMSKDLEEQIKRRVLSFLSGRGFSRLPFQITPDAVAWAHQLRGLEGLSRELSMMGIQTVERAGAIASDPIVEVSVLISEVRKKSMLAAGWKILDPVEAQLLPALTTGSIRARIELLESRGEAQVLASPTLISKSGKEAKFLAGGEFPIKMMNIQTNNVVWKPYGVMMSIRPTVTQEDRIHLAIATEVSSLDFSHSVDGIPALLSHRVSTEFDLERARTIAISGLIRKDRSEEKAGLPLLRSLPILGPLFGSTAFQEGESELVIFVTPRLQPNK